MATVELVVRGDQLGTFESFRGAGNNAGRRLVLRDVERIGDPDEFFTVIVEQVNPGTTQFQNGQFVTILDPDGDVVLPRTNVQPDAQQGRAAGDEHLVFLQAGIFIDLGGVPEEANRVVYREADETAGAEGDDDGELDFIDFPCFVAGTRIATPTGLRRVETLAPGDTLRTADGATVRVLWARGRCVDLTSIPGRHRPVEFKTGALGYRQLRLLRVSPDHRVRLSHPLAETLFGSRDVLVPAKALSRLPHCREMLGAREVTYVSVLTSQHAVIVAEGMAVETTFPGRETLRRLGPAARREVLDLLPGLGHRATETVYPPAGRFLTMREARTLLACAGRDASWVGEGALAA